MSFCIQGTACGGPTGPSEQQRNCFVSTASNPTTSAFGLKSQKAISVPLRDTNVPTEPLSSVPGNMDVFQREGWRIQVLCMLPHHQLSTASLSSLVLILFIRPPFAVLSAFPDKDHDRQSAEKPTAQAERQTGLLFSVLSHPALFQAGNCHVCKYF